MAEFHGLESINDILSIAPAISFGKTPQRFPFRHTRRSITMASMTCLRCVLIFTELEHMARHQAVQGASCTGSSPLAADDPVGGCGPVVRTGVESSAASQQSEDAETTEQRCGGLWDNRTVEDEIVDPVDGLGLPCFRYRKDRFETRAVR